MGCYNAQKSVSENTSLKHFTLKFSRIFREVFIFLWLHVKGLALTWDRVGDLGLHRNWHTCGLLWNVASLLYCRWYSCLLACRHCFKAVAAGRLHLHKFSKWIISGHGRCIRRLIFFVSSCGTKATSSPLVENCICLGGSVLWLKKNC